MQNLYIILNNNNNNELFLFDYNNVHFVNVSCYYCC